MDILTVFKKYSFFRELYFLYGKIGTVPNTYLYIYHITKKTLWLRVKKKIKIWQSSFKAKIKYLLTCKVSKYCLFALHDSVDEAQLRQVGLSTKH